MEPKYIEGLLDAYRTTLSFAIGSAMGAGASEDEIRVWVQHAMNTAKNVLEGEMPSPEN